MSENDPMHTFHARLKEAREDCGMTQKELSEQSGVNISQIVEFEAGRRYPSLLNFAKMLRVMGDYSHFLLQLPD